MQLVWDVVTPSRSLLFLIFSWGYTSAFSSFCGNTSQTFNYILRRHVIVGGNTFLIHSRLQSLLGLCWETHMYLCIIYIHSGNTRAYLCFYWLMKRRHMRVPLFFWSILLDILTRFQMQFLSSLHTRPAIVFSREHCVSDMFCKAV